MNYQPSFFDAPYCANCILAHLCGDKFSPSACPDTSFISLTRESNLHVKHPDFFFHFLRNRQFDHASVSAEQQIIPRLPPYVPILEPYPLSWVRGLPLTAVAVSLKRVVSRKGNSARRGAILRENFQLPGGAKLICVAFGKDGLLSAVDRVREERLREMAGLSFDLFTSLDFSVYDDDWPPERMESQAKSFISYDLLQRSGVPTVPHIAWSNEVDIQRLTDWLRANPGAKMVAFDLQSAGTALNWSDYLQSLDTFLSKAPALSYLVNGLADAERIADLRQRLPHMVLCNGFAYLMAQQGHEEFRYGDDTARARSTATKRDILLNYVAYFERLAMGDVIAYEPIGSPWQPEGQLFFVE